MTRFSVFLGLTLAMASATFASPMTFDFTFANVDTGASTVGQLTIDSATLATDLQNPDTNPISDLESLTMTVSGASAGNGTFGLSDFDSFAWWSAGATFDYSQNLVGQPTEANAWGTPDM